MTEKKKPVKKAKRIPGTDAMEFAMNAVTYSMDHDGWGEFTTTLGTNVLFDGSKDYYVHTKGADFVQRIHKLDGMSTEHSAVINAKVLYTAGQGVNIGDKPSKEMVAFFDNAPEAAAERAKAEIAEVLGHQYTSTMRAEDMAGVNLTKLTQLIAKDLVHYGGSYVLTYIAQGKITKQIHVPFHCVLRAKKKEGDVDGLAYWYITTTGSVDKDTPRVQQFSPRHMDANVQLVDLRLPHCADTMYAHPDYLAAMKWILLDGYIAEFFNAFAQRNYWLGGYIKTGKNPPKEVRERIQDEMDRRFGGTKNAARWMYMWGVDELTEVSSFPINSSDELFRNQQTWITRKIRTAHKVTEPALLGLPPDENGGSVFAAKDQLKTALTVWQNTVIAPIQFVITDWYNDALRFNGIRDTVTITAFSPFHEENENKNATSQVLNEGGTSTVSGSTEVMTGEAQPLTTNIQESNLNGAQQATYVDIVVKVGQGLITKESAIPLVRSLYPTLSRKDIEDTINGIKPIQSNNAPPANA